jgi:hypothetical protein
MSKGHRLMLWAGLLALLLAMPLGVAMAQETSEPETEQEHTLVADGYGLAQVGGWGRVDIRAHGGSVIWIVNAETLEITGDGGREETDSGVVKLTNWVGEIHASGKRFAVRLVGGQLDFTATGRGRAYLQGYGTFQLDEHEGRWRWRGMHIPRRPPFLPPGLGDGEGLAPPPGDPVPELAPDTGA